jgi:hypothetical protein
VASRKVDEIVADMSAGREIHFGDLVKVCDHYFGKPRQSGTRHHVYKMPWPGDPCVNIQNAKDKSKPYQGRQLLKAIAKLKEIAEAKKKK